MIRNLLNDPTSVVEVVVLVVVVMVVVVVVMVVVVRTSCWRLDGVI